MPRVISIYLPESCMWIQNLARILQDSCKISHSKGVDEKSHLFSVLLIKNSDISHDIWFSVSFSYQKHINIFSGIQNLARFLQVSCKILNPGYFFFHWIRLRKLFSKQKLASKMFPKTLVPRFIFWPWLISCKTLARILQVLNHLARFLQDLNPLITRDLLIVNHFLTSQLSAELSISLLPIRLEVIWHHIIENSNFTLILSVEMRINIKQKHTAISFQLDKNNPKLS